MRDSMDYQKLSYLGDKVKSGAASKEEKDEYMLILYQNGKITELQYQDYLKKLNTDELIEAGLAIGAIILIGYLISKEFENK